MDNFVPNLSGRVDNIVEQAIRELYLRLGILESQTAKLKSAPTSPPLTSPQLTQVQKALTISGSNPLNITGLLPKIIPALQGPRSARVQFAPLQYLGWFYYETDTTLLYLSNGSIWFYVSGVYAQTQSQLAGEGFGTADKGLLVNVTDYGHMLQWTGSAWQRASQDSDHSDTFHMFGAAPTDAGWHLCDGSVVNYLKYDGTLGSRTLPNTNATAAYAKFGSSYNATINAAAALTFSGGSYTPAGTVSQPTFTGTPFTPSGTVSQPTFSGNLLATHQHQLPFGGPSPNSTLYYLDVSFGSVGSVSGFSKWSVTSDSTGGLASYLTQAVSGGTPSGTVSQPTFTGNSVTPAGTVSQPTFTGTPATVSGTVNLTGDPIANFQLILYYRQ